MIRWIANWQTKRLYWPLTLAQQQHVANRSHNRFISISNRFQWNQMQPGRVLPRGGSLMVNAVGWLTNSNTLPPLRSWPISRDTQHATTLNTQPLTPSLETQGFVDLTGLGTFPQRTAITRNMHESKLIPPWLASGRFEMDRDNKINNKILYQYLGSSSRY